MNQIHEFLRSHTTPQHKQVDSHPLMARLLHEGLSRSHYASILAALAGAVQEIEGALQVYAVTHPHEKLPALHTRTLLIHDDLQALGVVAQLPEIGLPPIRSNAAFAGVLYVLEGSRLGGAFLAKRLDVLHGGVLPSRFFSATGQDSVQLWRSYLQWAQTSIPLSEYPAALAGADAAFACYLAHMNHQQQTLHGPLEKA